LKQYGKLDLRCMDCMDLMREYPDNHFDLAICDVPYGIGECGANNESRTKPFGSRKDKKNTRGTKIAAKKYKAFAGMDKKPPSPAYFKELRRVSKNQIIWGANHFIDNIKAAASPCWIVWDKLNSGDFADCELAWTSFKTAVRKFSFMWNGMLQGDMKNKEYRIHPTQKPVALYKWLLQNYGKSECKRCRGGGEMPDDDFNPVFCTDCNGTGTYHAKILDTHLGSGSIAIACYYMGFDLTGSELDPDYYQAMMERIDRETQQQELNLSYETK